MSFSVTGVVAAAFAEKVTKGGDVDGANLVIGTLDAHDVVIKRNGATVLNIASGSCQVFGNLSSAGALRGASLISDTSVGLETDVLLNTSATSAAGRLVWDSAGDRDTYIHSRSDGLIETTHNNVHTVTCGSDGLIHKGLHNQTTVGGLTATTLSKDYPCILSHAATYTDFVLVQELDNTAQVVTQDVFPIRLMYTRVGNLVRCVFQMMYMFATSTRHGMRLSFLLRYTKHVPAASYFYGSRTTGICNYGGRLFLDAYTSGAATVTTTGSGPQVEFTAWQSSNLPGGFMMNLNGDVTYEITES